MMAKRKHSSSLSSEEALEGSAFGSKLSSSESKRIKSSQELINTCIFFAKNPITVSELQEKLKLALVPYKRKDSNGRKSIKVHEIPKCIESLSKFTKEHLSFTLNDIDWNKKSSVPPRLRDELFEIEEEAIEIVNEAIKHNIEFSEKVQNGETEDSSLILIDKLSTRMFFDWSKNTTRFLVEIKKTIGKLRHPVAAPPEPIRDNVDSEILRESAFTSLFMKFTEIFFLEPDVGENRRIAIKIRNKSFGCIPDVRFCRHQAKVGSSYLLLMLAEVKKAALNEPGHEDDSTWIEKHIKKEVLEQIGSQLLSECWNSVFFPKGLGIICMRTEIIFLYLDTDFNYFNALMENNISDSLKSMISYTKSFDIMKMDTRNELIDFLFWLGCLQTEDFKDRFFV